MELFHQLNLKSLLVLSCTSFQENKLNFPIALPFCKIHAISCLSNVNKSHTFYSKSSTFFAVSLQNSCKTKACLFFRNCFQIKNSFTHLDFL